MGVCGVVAQFPVVLDPLQATQPPLWGLEKPQAPPLQPTAWRHPACSPLYIRGSRYLWKSQTTPQSMLGGTPDCCVHHCRALTSPTIWSLLSTWMSLGPWGLGGKGGRKSWHPKLASLDAAFHQLDVFLCAAGILNPATCFLASSCMWASLSGQASLCWRDWDSGHQLGTPSLSARYMRTQWLRLSNGSRAAGLQDLALHWAHLVAWDWLLWAFDAVNVGAGRHWASGHSTVSLGLGVSFRYSQGSMAASWASWGSSSSSRSTASPVSVGDILGPSSMSLSSESSTISSPSRCIRGTIHLWRSHTTSHRTQRGIPNLSAQHCRAWARAKVSSCLVTQKTLVLGRSLWGRKSWWPNPWMLHGATHLPVALSWAVGSWKAMACCQASYLAKVLQSLLIDSL